MKTATDLSKLPKGNKINPELDGKYHNDPAVLKKLERVRGILRVAGLPKDK